MSLHYGVRLLQFAQTIDIVDKAAFESVLRLIENYVYETLKIKHVRIMIDRKSSDKILYLDKYDLKFKPSNDFCRVTDSAGEYTGQMAFSYDQEVPLWVVGKNKKCLLNESDDYVDLWSAQSNIPKYATSGIEGIQTSIIIPISKTGRKFGVVNFEAAESLDITDEAKVELERIAETISILYKSSMFRETLVNNTKDAINDLRGLLNDECVHPLTKPKIFLASSAKAESDVIDIVHDVLKKHADDVDVIYWKEIPEPGNITFHVFNTIAQCRYAICYLSEINENSQEPMYKDNPNVIFEAGMFHGRMKHALSTISNWIPIRERNSPKSPADFAAERTVFIDREKDKIIDPEKLFNDIDAQLYALLNNSGC